MDRTELSHRINELGLAKFATEIHAAALPCLHFATVRATAPVPTDQSKLGGPPELPVGMDWPRDQDQEIPLQFLGRIAERDLRRLFPHLRGHLLFFGEWLYAREGRIIHVPADARVAPQTCPERPADSLGPLAECHLQGVEALALPSAHERFEAWRYSPELLTWGEPQPGQPRSHHLTPLEQLVEATYDMSSARTRPHRLFGYPLFTQGHPAMAAEQYFKHHNPRTGPPPPDFVAAASRWCAVLSLETDHTAELAFGDTGNCGFLITKDALAAGDFSRCESYQDEC